MTGCFEHPVFFFVFVFISGLADVDQADSSTPKVHCMSCLSVTVKQHLSGRAQSEMENEMLNLLPAAQGVKSKTLLLWFFFSHKREAVAAAGSQPERAEAVSSHRQQQSPFIIILLMAARSVVELDDRKIKDPHSECTHTDRPGVNYRRKQQTRC